MALGCQPLEYFLDQFILHFPIQSTPDIWLLLNKLVFLHSVILPSIHESTCNDCNGFHKFLQVTIEDKDVSCTYCAEYIQIQLQYVLHKPQNIYLCIARFKRYNYTFGKTINSSNSCCLFISFCDHIHIIFLAHIGMYILLSLWMW
jgi:hypothetical protein